MYESEATMDNSDNGDTPAKRPATTASKPKASNSAKQRVHRNSVAALNNVISLRGITSEDGRTSKAGGALYGIQEDGEIEPRGYSTSMGQSPRVLTEKQESFAQGVSQGMTLSGAYRTAYGCEGWQDGAVWANASKLAKQAKVQQRIKALDIGLRPKTPHDPGEVKAAIVKTLVSILKDEQAETKDRMKAAELLGRWGEVALFDEHSTIKVENVQPEAAVEALKEKLAKLKAG